TLAVNRHEMTNVKTGKSVSQISARDFELLVLLVKAENAVISREEIITKIWGGGEGSHPRTIDNAIVRLRHLLRELESKNQIRSVRGVGYQWIAQDGS